MLKKHFETGMLMSPKKVFILCHSTVHTENIHTKRPNDRKTHARWTEGEWAQSIGNAFFMVDQIIKYFVVQIVVIYNSGTYR